MNREEKIMTIRGLFVQVERRFNSPRSTGNSRAE
jgi:hypothetical protein